jgi:hypothetical protein
MQRYGVPTSRINVLRHADVDGGKLKVDAETTLLRRKVRPAAPLDFGCHEKRGRE